jgi:hypothetical protein
VDVELYSLRCGVQFFKMVRVPTIAASLNKTPHVLQCTENKNKVDVMYYKPIMNSLGQYNNKFATETITVSKEFFDSTYAEVLRADNGRFTVASIVNILTTRNTQLLVNGAAWIKKNELSAVDNYRLAHALFVMAFVEKIDMQNVTQTITDYIKRVRSINSSNFIVRILYNIYYDIFGDNIHVYADLNTNDFRKFIHDIISYKQRIGAFSKQHPYELKTSSNCDNISVPGVTTNNNTRSCNIAFDSNITVDGNGNCGPASIAYFLNNSTVMDIRKQVYNYLNASGKNTGACDQDKVFVSPNFLRTAAMLNSFNLCMHDGYLNTRVYCDNGFDKTIHVNFSNSHFSPCTTQSTEVKYQNIIDTNDVIAATDSTIKVGIETNYINTNKILVGGYDLSPLWDNLTNVLVLVLSLFYFLNLLSQPAVLIYVIIACYNSTRSINFSTLRYIVIFIMFCFSFSTYGSLLFYVNVYYAYKKLPSYLTVDNFKALSILVTAFVCFIYFSRFIIYLFTYQHVESNGYFCTTVSGLFTTQTVCAWDSIVGLNTVLNYNYGVTMFNDYSEIVGDQKNYFALNLFVLLFLISIIILNKSTKTFGGAITNNTIIYILCCIALWRIITGLDYHYQFVSPLCFSKSNIFVNEKYCAYDSFPRFFEFLYYYFFGFPNSVQTPSILSVIVISVINFVKTVVYTIMTLFVAYFSCKYYLSLPAGTPQSVTINTFVKDIKTEDEVKQEKVINTSETLVQNTLEENSDSETEDEQEQIVEDQTPEQPQQEIDVMEKIDTIVFTNNKYAQGENDNNIDVEEEDDEIVDEEEENEDSYWPENVFTCPDNLILDQEMDLLDPEAVDDTCVVHLVRDFDAASFQGFAAEVERVTDNYQKKWQDAIDQKKTSFWTVTKQGVRVLNILSNKANCLKVLKSELEYTVKNWPGKKALSNIYAPVLACGIFGRDFHTDILPILEPLNTEFYIFGYDHENYINSNNGVMKKDF